MRPTSLPWHQCALAAAGFLLACAASTAAVAAPIFPADSFPGLHEELLRHERAFYQVSARPFGLSLDSHFKVEDVATVDAWLAQDGEPDLETFAGKHPFEMLHTYGEYGDLGFFRGAGVVGTAFRYLALKKEGASEEALAEARARVVAAADSWHVFYQVGGQGVVTRGIRLLRPIEEGAPPIPNAMVPTVPLFDVDGKPLPQPKNNGTYRDDNSAGVLEEGRWGWTDSCSKDQMVGQILGMVSLYEAMHGDDGFEQALVERIRGDARMVAKMLMEKRDISTLETPMGKGEFDLIIMDADGRATFHHDLNPRSIEKFYAPAGATVFNLFNGIMAMAVMKGLFHVTGDEDIEAFLYEELLGERRFLEWLPADADPKPLDYIYMGLRTNTDNPDMTAVALFLNLYLEKDPEVARPLRTFLEERWWDRPDESRTAKLSKQVYWHAFYMALTDRGVDPALIQETADLLTAYELGPYWNPERINCDEDEIEAGSCLAVDGETVLTLAGQDDKGRWMATEALDPSIRAPSNFDARSNPFRVNGGGGLRLNPGPDLLAAYWLGRFMEANPAGTANLSPNAREHMPVGGEPEPVDPGPEPVDPGPEPVSLDAGGTSADSGAASSDTGAAASDPGADPGSVGPLAPDPGPDPGSSTLSGGGGCANGAPAGLPLLALCFVLAALRRRRLLG
jgi:hypothetical protein